VRKKGRERWERTHPLHEKMVSHPSFVDRQSPEILLVSDSLRSNDGIGGDELVNGIIATQVVIQRWVIDRIWTEVREAQIIAPASSIDSGLEGVPPAGPFVEDEDSRENLDHTNVSSGYSMKFLVR
jgi:hypothetical protein